jgi:ABC-2 type transport system ATP-binding protein
VVATRSAELGAKPTDDTRAPVIRTVDLRKTYESGGRSLNAVDGIDLTVREGEFFGLLGPNGAGKSTTIGMLTTRVRPTSGQAFVGEIDVVQDASRAKLLLGVVSQTNTLDRSLTVAENLEFHGRYFGMSARDSRERGAELLERFGLADRADAMAEELSGGMAQRLMIARALTHRPRVLFLDEPTSGIDPQSRLNLWDMLRELHRDGQTILLTTHYMEEADALCERVAVIDHGQVLADGTPDELKRSIGTDTIVTVTFDGPAVDIASTLEALPGVHKVEIPDDAAGDTLRVFAPHPEGLVRLIVEAGDAHDRQVVDASSQPPSLETVFLTLTGREYRE